MKCIYHGSCVDGFTAATIVRYNFRECEMVAGVHGEAPPTIMPGEEVIIVDFSYKRDVILELAKEAGEILIIDHHVSAQKESVDLPDNVTTVFDMEESGASLTWKYFHPEEDVPEFVRYVRDRDLWENELPYTKEIAMGIFAQDYDFDYYSDYVYYWDDMNELHREGEILLDKQDKDIKEFLVNHMFKTEIAGHEVPCANIPYMWASDAGSLMAEGQSFAATYYDSRDTRNYSLRSDKDGMDVSVIASKLGGGGHKHAAGFKVKRNGM